MERSFSSKMDQADAPHLKPSRIDGQPARSQSLLSMLRNMDVLISTATCTSASCDQLCRLRNPVLGEGDPSHTVVASLWFTLDVCVHMSFVCRAF